MIEYIIWYAVIALVFFASGTADDLSGVGDIEIMPNIMMGVFGLLLLINNYV